MGNESRRRFALILAAGEGSRMKSQHPKAVCELLMKPMVCWVQEACHAAGIEEIYVVTAQDHTQRYEKLIKPSGFFVQSEALGSAHAVKVAAQSLQAGGDLLVLCADMPLVDAAQIDACYQQHIVQKNAITFASADPESGVGFYWFDAAFLSEILSQLPQKSSGQQTDLCEVATLAAQQGQKVGQYLVSDGDTMWDVNDRRTLQKLNEMVRWQQIAYHLDNGVDIACADGIVIAKGVKIAADARILPGTILLGETEIAADAVVGPNSYLVNAKVGARSKIIASYLTDSTVGADASIGPFSQMRPNSHLADGVKVGDFVEIKNATIGEKTSIAHLTYIGDSDVGKLCNFGCGVVTANYNGKEKFRTKIGDRAFVGCNTNLISPVNIGEGAYTAAGTTVSQDVPDSALAIGRPDTIIKEGWADRNIAFKK